MATYHVTSPDGHVYEVTGPDGASQDDVLKQVMAQHQASAPAAPKLDGTSDSSLENFAAGVGKSLVDTGHGIVQAGTDAARYAVESNPLIFGEHGADGLKAKVAQQQADETARRKVDAPLMGTKAGLGGDLAGNVAMALAIPESRVAGASRLAQVGKAAAGGAAYGLSQPVATGESRSVNTAIGAGLGAAGQTVAGSLRNAGVKAANAVPDEVRQVWQKARQMGIDLTPAQLSDSRIVKYMASQFGMMPLSGGQASHEAQSGQWNRQVANAIGVDAPRVTPEVYAAKKAADSAKFNDLTARNNLTVTGELARKLHAIQQDAKVAGGEVHDAVSNAIDRLYSQMTPDGQVPGRAYQALDSALGQATRGGTPVAHYVGQVKGAIRDAMDQSISPEDAAAWKQLRTEYGNRKTIRNLVASADGADLSPAQLKARVNATNYGKEAMASGKAGTMGDLAKIGSRMKEPPSSGTAERLAVNKLFTNPLSWPGLVAMGAAGRVANSNRLTKVLMRDGRGKTAQRLAVIARGAPALIRQKRNDDTGE